MKTIRRWAPGGVALLLAVFLGAAGCDWLSGSGSDTRVSPYLSDISISRFSVLCDQSFTVNFQYDDPQDDILQLLVTYTHTTDNVVREDPVDWVTGSRLTFPSGDRAAYSYSFPCGENISRGKWTVSIQTEDSRGHKSNSLTETINLTSS